MQILPYGESGGMFGASERDWTLSAGSDAATAFAGLLSQHASAGSTHHGAPVSPMTNPARLDAETRPEDRVRSGADSPNGLAMGNREVTREDFAAMRQELRSQGYAEKDLDRLEQRVSEGVTWRELLRDLSELARLSRLGNAREMSVERATLLQSLFQKTGFSSTEAESLVKSLGAGNTRQVLDALKRQIGSLPADTTLSLRPAELKALGESIDLSAKGGETLKGLIGQAGVGPNGRILITPEGLRGMLTVLHNESSDGVGYIQRMEAMQKLVGDILRQAQAKAQGESNADRLGQDAGDKLLAASKDGMKAKHVQGLGEQAEKVADKKDEGLGDLGGKAQDKSALPRSLLAAGMPAEPAAQAVPDFRSAAAAGRQGPASGQIFQQVQSGILQNLSNGAQQLTIDLTPEHLGAVQVRLHLREGELNGMIRAESPEAARAISEQLAQLRQALEQQGLKVASLEVQTGPSNQQPQGGPWSGAEGHNLMQERQERARMQRLSALRGQAGERSVAADDSMTPRMGGVVTSESVDYFA